MADDVLKIYLSDEANDMYNISGYDPEAFGINVWDNGLSVSMDNWFVRFNFNKEEFYITRFGDSMDMKELRHDLVRHASKDTLDAQRVEMAIKLLECDDDTLMRMKLLFG